MEEEGVDSWYEEERQKVFNKYLENIEKNENREEAEKKYKEEMKKIREKYMNLYEKSKKASERAKVFKKNLEMIKGFMGKLKSRISKKK